MGEGIGKAFMILNVFAVIGVLAILFGGIYGLFKLITWIF